MIRLKEKNRRLSQAIGLDTLAIIFSVPLPEMVTLIKDLDLEGAITVSAPKAESKSKAGTITLNKE